jgi:hypothetical protein
MDFLAVLDYEHLDNGMFLTTFAKTLSKKEKRGIIIHGESEYTERIIQTGVMRDEATLRSIKDLNHRLVALFADEGVSTIALNGYQKSTIRHENGELHVDAEYLKNLPVQPMILLSSLAEDFNSGKPVNIPLPLLAKSLQSIFEISEVTIFSKKENIEIYSETLPDNVIITNQSDQFVETHIPKSFHNYDQPVNIHSPSSF